MPVSRRSYVQQARAAICAAVARLCCGRPISAGQSETDGNAADAADAWWRQRLLDLNALQERLRHADSMELRLRRIADAVVGMLDLDACRIWTVGPADVCRDGCRHAVADAPRQACQRRDRCLHLAAGSGRNLQVLGDDQRLPLDGFPLARVMWGAPPTVLLNAACAEVCDEDRAWVQELGYRAVAGYRLAHGDGGAIGLLAVFAQRPLSAAEDALLRNVAAIATRVILDAQVQSELQRQQMLAAAAHRAKSEFLANMSHEIRTPMTAILGFYELLLMTEFPVDQQRECLLTIQRNGRALLDMLNGLLELAKIEVNTLNVDRVECCLEEVVDGLVSAMSSRVREKGLALEIEYVDRVPSRVHTAPKRLRQILLHLVDNAVKFTERGLVHVSIRLIAGPEGHATLQFAVSDTGIGIASDKLGELFQPFVQIDGSSTRRYGGTGLGLALARRLAQSLGGDITVRSELGKGSTFTLSIDPGPLGDVLRLAARSYVAIAADDASSVAGASSLHGKVLLVEDANDVRHLLGRILRRWGLVVDLAENGRVGCREAERARAEAAPYDLILMDMQMPEMDGFDATRWLRAHGWQGPIVALTAHAMPGDREHCLDVGCDDYCAKPVEIAELYQLLRRYLRPTRPTSDAATAALLDMTREGNPALTPPVVAELRDKVCADLAAQTEKIQAAFVARDVNSVARLARKMQSSADIFGLQRIAREARFVWANAGKDCQLEQLQASVAVLKELCRSAVSPVSSEEPGDAVFNVTSTPGRG